MTAEPAPFSVAHDRVGAHLTLYVTGEVDPATAPELTRYATGHIDTAVERVWIDLSGVTFCDSSGLRALVTIDEEVTAREAQLVLYRPSAILCRCLEITGLREQFVISAPCSDEPTTGDPTG